MCAEGMVDGAILAKAMVATLPAAQRRRALAVWMVRRGSPWDIQCAPALSGGIRIFNAAVQKRLVQRRILATRLKFRKNIKATWLK